MKSLNIKTYFSRLTRVFIVNLSITLVFFSIVIPGIIWDRNNTFQAVDQNNYHLRQVEIFVNNHPTIGTYPSTTATTPGHHLVLAWISKHLADGKVGREIFPIRIANALFGLGLILTLWWLAYLGGALNVIDSTVLVLPFLFSYQFLGSAIWVMTDNAALLWVCLTLLLLTLSTPTSLNRDNFTLTLAGVFATLALAWRQINVWLLAPLFLRVAKARCKHQHWKLYLATLLPPLLLLGYFVWLWHGLIPPEFKHQHARGFNLAVPTYIVSLFGIFGLFYLGYLSTELKKSNTRQTFWLIVTSVIIGLGIAILFPSTYNRHAGRWGGWLWEISKYLPSIYDRSLLFLVLTPLGTVLIALWYKKTYHNKNSNDILIFISMMAWIAAYTANTQAFQRYYEPLILISLAFLASRQADRFRLSYIGPLILTGLMAAISLQQIVFS